MIINELGKSLLCLVTEFQIYVAENLAQLWSDNINILEIQTYIFDKKLLSLKFLEESREINAVEFYNRVKEIIASNKEQALRPSIQFFETNAKINYLLETKMPLNEGNK